MDPIFAGKKRRMRGRFCMVFWLLAAVPFLFAVDYYREGEELFRRNAPAEAIPLLYQASLQPGTDPRVFVYLGLCYQQEGKYSDAVSTFIKGTSAPGADKKVLFFNAGNVYFTQQLFPQAEEMYSRAIASDASYAPAFLNRANARIRQQKLDEAASDYTVYLTLDPASWQKDAIRNVVSMIEEERLIREEAAARAEAERAAAEAERKAAEERFQRLMDEVNSSLQAVDGASVFSAGSEDVMGYEEEGELE